MELCDRADNMDLTWILSSKGKKYTQCRVQLEEELQLPDSRELSCQIAWNSYEKAYKSLCVEVMRTGELDMLKNRRCGSGVVDVMRRHILLRSKYLAKTGDKECKLMTEENLKFVWPKCHKEFEKEDPQTKLGTFLTIVTTELKKWASPMEKRKLIEELIDLVSVDGILEKIEKDMKQLIHADPETSLEILEKKAKLVKILHNKWNICNEEVLDQLKHRDHYLAFKDSWRHLKAALPLHWERELLLLKQLFAAKPGLEVVTSVEQFWKVLDVTCCQYVIKPIQGAHLMQAAPLEAEDERDIEQLLEFIEGEDGKEKKKDQSEKKKKRKKKKNAAEQSTSDEVKAEADLKQNTSTKDDAVAPDTLESTESSLDSTQLDDQVDRTPISDPSNPSMYSTNPESESFQKKHKRESRKPKNVLNEFKSENNSEDLASVPQNLGKADGKGKTKKKKAEKGKMVCKEGHRSNVDDQDYLIPSHPISYNYPSYEGKKSDFPSLGGNNSMSGSSEATKKVLATPWATVVRTDKAVNNSSGKEDPAATIKVNETGEEELEKTKDDKVGEMRRKQSGHLVDKELVTAQKISIDEVEKGKVESKKWQQRNEKDEKDWWQEPTPLAMQRKRERELWREERRLELKETELDGEKFREREIERMNEKDQVLDKRQLELREKELLKVKEREQNKLEEKQKLVEERKRALSEETNEAVLRHDTVKSNLKPSKLDDQRVQIEGKESLIQQRRDFLEQIVEVYGKKMAKFITDIEAAEDEKNEKLKEKFAVEMQISDLKVKHEILEREVEEKDKTINDLIREKRDLEAYIENSVHRTKKEIALLEEDMKSLKTCLSPQPLKETRNDASFAKGESQQLNLQLIEFISSKILAKEEELECPVCFEVASPPIFACNDLHLICSHCRPKVSNTFETSSQLGLGWITHFAFQVSICPECREPYPEKGKRHRYAEKAAEELAGLVEERARVMDKQA